MNKLQKGFQNMLGTIPTRSLLANLSQRLGVSIAIILRRDRLQKLSVIESWRYTKYGKQSNLYDRRRVLKGCSCKRF